MTFYSWSVTVVVNTSPKHVLVKKRDFQTEADAIQFYEVAKSATEKLDADWLFSEFEMFAHEGKYKIGNLFKNTTSVTKIK